MCFVVQAYRIPWYAETYSLQLGNLTSFLTIVTLLHCKIAHNGILMSPWEVNLRGSFRNFLSMESVNKLCPKSYECNSRWIGIQEPFSCSGIMVLHTWRNSALNVVQSILPRTGRKEIHEDGVLAGVQILFQAFYESCYPCHEPSFECKDLTKVRSLKSFLQRFSLQHCSFTLISPFLQLRWMNFGELYLLSRIRRVVAKRPPPPKEALSGCNTNSEYLIDICSEQREEAPLEEVLTRL